MFGLLKRSGKGYTKIIAEVSRVILVPIIEREVIPDSIVYSDCWTGYHALDVSDFKPVRIHHPKLFANGRNHINGIKNFWNQAKRHLRKFNGVPTRAFWLVFEGVRVAF